MANGYKKEEYPIPTDNSSSRMSSGNYFLLLTVTVGGLGDVLFDTIHMEYNIDNSVIVVFLLFGGLLLEIPRERSIVNNLKFVFCGCHSFQVVFMFDETNRWKNFK